MREEVAARRLLLALHPIDERTWIGAVMFADGRIELVHLRAAYMGVCSPPALEPVLNMEPLQDSTLELLLAFEDGRFLDEEFLVIELQRIYVSCVRIVGVTAVSPVAVLNKLGLVPDLDITTVEGRASAVAAVNTAVEGEFNADQFDQAWAVGMAVAGGVGPWSLPAVFAMLPTPRRSIPSEHQAARRGTDTTDPVLEGITAAAEFPQDEQVDNPRSDPALSPTSRRRTTARRQHHRPSVSPELLSVREVAGVLGVSVPTVRRLIRCGDICAGKVGCQIRVPIASLNEYRQNSSLRAPRATNLVALPAPTDTEDEEAVGLRLADRLGLR